MIGQFVTA